MLSGFVSGATAESLVDETVRWTSKSVAAEGTYRSTDLEVHRTGIGWQSLALDEQEVQRSRADLLGDRGHALHDLACPRCCLDLSLELPQSLWLMRPYDGLPSPSLLREHIGRRTWKSIVRGLAGSPLLWMNKKFSDRERIFWAIVVTLYTILLVLGAVWICLWSYRRVFG